MTDGQRQERIRWLADLSAARRALRAAGLSAPYVIWFQTTPDANPSRNHVNAVRAHSPTWASSSPRVLEHDKRGRPLEISRQRLQHIVRVQDGRCYLCGEPMPENDRSREHVTPRSRGGRNAANVLAAHEACNARKGSREPYPCELIYLAAVTLRLAQ